MSVKFEDYYKTLGVKRDAPADEIKRAYRKLAQKFHPDRNKEPDAADRFSKIGEAYEVLKDTDKRQRYDQFGENYKAGQDFRPPPGYEGFHGHSGNAQGFDFEGQDFSDFFRQMFGGTGGPQSAGNGNPFAGFNQQAAPPREQQADITVSLHDAYHGSTRQLTVQGPAGKKSIDVKIPPRVKPGSKIRLKGEHLVLKINVAPDPRFRLDPATGHLTTDVPLSPPTAALGGKADVQTLDGTVSLTIPPGSASGSKLRLAGKGLGPASKRGDLFAQLKITTPKTLTDPQRDLYQQLKDLENQEAE